MSSKSCVFLALVLLVGAQSINCPNLDSSKYDIDCWTFIYSAETDAVVTIMVTGPISGDIYLNGNAYTGTSDKTIIRRVDSSLNDVYFKKVDWKLNTKAFTISDDEMFMYYILHDNTKFHIIKMDTSDATVLLSEYTSLVIGQLGKPIIIMLDSITMLASSSDGSNGHLMRIDANLNNVCAIDYEVLNGYSHPTALLKIGSVTSFIIVPKSTNDVILFQKIDHTSFAPEWGLMVDCPIASCTPGNAAAALDTNNNRIWTFTTFDSITGKVLLAAIDHTTGTIHNSFKYLRTNTCTGSVEDLLYLDDKLYMIDVCDNYVFTILDTTENAFSSFEFASDYFPSTIIVDPSNKFIRLAGGFQDSLNYYVSLYEEGLPYLSHSSMINGDYLVQADNEYLASSGSILNSVLTTTTLTSAHPSMTTSGASVLQVTHLYISGVYYDSTEISLVLSSNTNTTAQLSLTCVTSGSTNIDYSLSDYEGGVVPSWVSLDDNTGILSISSPDVTTPTTFTFSVLSEVTGNSEDIHKPIHITVMPCETNCQECEAWDPNQCTECIGGYKLNDGECRIEAIVGDDTDDDVDDKVAKITTTTTLSSIVASIGMIIVSSAVTGSAVVGAWSLVNQVQMLILILLMRAQVPQTIVKFLTGLDFAMFSFNFVVDSEEGMPSKVSNWFGDQQQNEHLDDIGLEFDSTLSNNLSLALILLGLSIAILLLLPLVKLLNAKLKSYAMLLKVMNRLYQYISIITLYRMALETSQFLLLNSMSEVGNWEFVTAGKIISFCVSFLVLILETAFVVFHAIAWHRSRNTITWPNYCYLKLVFDGLKVTTAARAYPMLLLIRRYLLVLFLTQLICYNADLATEGLIAVAYCILIPYVILLFKIRPFEKFRDNLIELVNELYFLFFVGMLFYFNTTQRWERKIGSETVTNVYMFIIAGNSMTTFLITLIDFMVMVVKLCKQWTAKIRRVDKKPPVIQTNTNGISADQSTNLHLNENVIGSHIPSKRRYQEEVKFSDGKFDFYKKKL